ncbi:hypothetical protein GTZ99_11080 [Novosphingobium sp. FSY-8]|uniref:Uncharacterized protein n=1 Tax=Novosphingobium ovatum TaxID=1908523 RepID=A0ABW9XEY6_9SPHN|nr:hypothetical protein [Novosphingobium ovatum]
MRHEPPTGQRNSDEAMLAWNGGMAVTGLLHFAPGPPQAKQRGMDDGGKSQGIPRWLIWAFAAKMALVVVVVAAVIWWANR